MNFEDYMIFVIPHRYGETQPIKDAETWINAVQNDLTTIFSSRVGKAVLSAIRWHGVSVTIQPAKGCGARTWPIEDDLKLNKAGPLQISQGVSIWFSPENHVLGNACEARYTGLGQFHMESNEVLLHELVHAVRMVSFKFDLDALKAVGKGLANFDTNEEVYAVLVQGIYASERKTPVRSSHTGHFEIDPELNGSLAFFKTGTETFQYVRQFCQDNPGLTQAIADVDVPFNPLNAYYMKPSVAEKMSRSKFAKDRDRSVPILKMVVDFVKQHVR
jgi:hypothetical protein